MKANTHFVRFRDFACGVTAPLTCAALLGSAALSQATLLWSDNFNNYSDGSLAHQTGGGAGTPGWGPNNWFAVGGGGTVNVTTGVVNGNGDIRHGLDATFSATVGSTGTIWISFDWGHDSSHSNTYGGLSLFDGDNSTERVLIGNTYDPANWNMNGAPTDTGVSNIGMKTGVARITLNLGAANDVIDLWVAATGSPVDVSGAPMATTSNRDLANVSIIRIMGNNDQKFDNLKIGTTMLDVAAIPEPSAALLGGLGMLALLRRRRA